MTKLQKVEQIRKQLETFSAIFKKAGIKDNYLMILENVNWLKMDWLKTAHEWLTNSVEPLVRSVEKIIDLLPDKVWTQYILMGDCEDLREMRMLKKALGDLRTMVVSKRRPDFFKKGLVDDEIKERAAKALDAQGKTRVQNQESRNTVDADIRNTD